MTTCKLTQSSNIVEVVNRFSSAVPYTIIKSFAQKNAQHGLNDEVLAQIQQLNEYYIDKHRVKNLTK